MTKIEMMKPSEEFARCWNAAGRHLDAQVQGQMNWLKAMLTPPFLEHLSFRLGNQLFFVRVEPDGHSEGVPASRQGLIYIADECKGHAFVMPMVKKNGKWQPHLPGWGLLDVRTNELIDPIKCVSEEPIPMTQWEIQDFAVQVVRNMLESDGYSLMSWNANPHVNPSICFVGDEGPEWIIVRAVVTPEATLVLPQNWHSIVEACSRNGKVGSLISMTLSNSSNAPPPPAGTLWRGHKITVSNVESKLLTYS